MNSFFASFSSPKTLPTISASVLMLTSDYLLVGTFKKLKVLWVTRVSLLTNLN